MEIVINASPLILLGKIGRLHLLETLFEAVHIPTAVLNETKASGRYDGKIDLSSISFTELAASNRVAVQGLLGRLHLGEVEVIIGAVEKGIPLVALDDNSARNKAKQFGLDVTGTLGILLRASKTGHVTMNMDEEILKLKSAGMYISDKIISSIKE